MKNESTPAASILVVGDTGENLRQLARVLGEQAYDVRPVTTGADALQAAERDPPHLILLDVALHGMDGHEACQRLKGVERVRDVPVILLIASNDAATRLKAFHAGADDYITKPFLFEEILARVHAHVTLREARVERLQIHECLQVFEKMRNDLVHDMRSPLTVILGNLECLGADIADGVTPQSSAYLQEALRATIVINRMMSELLDIGRLEEGNTLLARLRCSSEG